MWHELSVRLGLLNNNATCPGGTQSLATIAASRGHVRESERVCIHMEASENVACAEENFAFFFSSPIPHNG